MDRRSLLKRFAGALVGLSAIRAATPEQVQAVEGVPMPAMVPGQPYCTHCDAHLMPSFDWQGSDHLAVRLWDRTDRGRQLQERQQGTSYDVDGVRVPYVFEAIQGNPGWVLAQRVIVTDGGRRFNDYCRTCFNDDIRELHIGKVVSFQEHAR